ncbi:MAG: hypothetical protein ACYS18_06895 [Planctomycetota bacterium]|jgi:hypothetical protein
MNRKQKISLLCGTVAVVFGGLNTIVDFYHPGFDIYLVIVIALTAGCFYTLRDKESKTEKDNKAGNQRDMNVQ